MVYSLSDVQRVEEENADDYGLFFCLRYSSESSTTSSYPTRSLRRRDMHVCCCLLQRPWRLTKVLPMNRVLHCSPALALHLHLKLVFFCQLNRVRVDPAWTPGLDQLEYLHVILDSCCLGLNLAASPQPSFPRNPGRGQRCLVWLELESESRLEARTSTIHN